MWRQWKNVKDATTKARAKTCQKEKDGERLNFERASDSETEENQFMENRSSWARRAHEQINRIIRRPWSQNRMEERGTQEKA